MTSSMQVFTQRDFLPFVNPLEFGIVFITILFFLKQKWPYKNERVELRKDNDWIWMTPFPPGQFEGCFLSLL